MKRLEDYTNEELRILTQAQIETLVDLECAHEGIPLLPELPEKPVVNKPQPDLTLFHVSAVYFKNREDADQVIELMNSMPRMHNKYYNDGYIDLDDPVVSSEVKEFSEDAKLRTKSQAEAAKEIEDQYKSLKNEYDKVASKRKDIIKNVREAVSEAFDEYRKMEQYKKQYARYLQLAEGEKDIALNFMKAAHPDEDEYIEEILGKISDDIMLGNKINPDIRAPLPG